MEIFTPLHTHSTDFYFFLNFLDASGEQRQFSTASANGADTRIFSYVSVIKREGKVFVAITSKLQV